MPEQLTPASTESPTPEGLVSPDAVNPQVVDPGVLANTGMLNRIKQRRTTRKIVKNNLKEADRRSRTLFDAGMVYGNDIGTDDYQPSVTGTKAIKDVGGFYAERKANWQARRSRSLTQEVNSRPIPISQITKVKEIKSDPFASVSTSLEDLKHRREIDPRLSLALGSRGNPVSIEDYHLGKVRPLVSMATGAALKKLRAELNIPDDERLPVKDVDAIQKRIRRDYLEDYLATIPANMLSDREKDQIRANYGVAAQRKNDKAGNRNKDRDHDNDRSDGQRGRRHNQDASKRKIPDWVPRDINKARDLGVFANEVADELVAKLRESDNILLNEAVTNLGLADLSDLPEDEKKDLLKQSRKAVADKYLGELASSGKSSGNYDDEDAWTLAQALAAARKLSSLGYSIDDIDTDDTI